MKPQSISETFTNPLLGSSAPSDMEAQSGESAEPDDGLEAVHSDEEAAGWTHFSTWLSPVQDALVAPQRWHETRRQVRWDNYLAQAHHLAVAGDQAAKDWDALAAQVRWDWPSFKLHELIDTKVGSETLLRRLYNNRQSSALIALSKHLESGTYDNASLRVEDNIGLYETFKLSPVLEVGEFGWGLVVPRRDGRFYAGDVDHSGWPHGDGKILNSNHPNFFIKGYWEGQGEQDDKYCYLGYRGGLRARSAQWALEKIGILEGDLLLASDGSLQYLGQNYTVRGADYNLTGRPLSTTSGKKFQGILKRGQTQYDGIFQTDFTSSYTTVGRCKITYPKGTTYQGEVKGFLRHGEGTYQDGQGRTLFGTWADDNFVGPGYLVEANGKVQQDTAHIAAMSLRMGESLSPASAAPRVDALTAELRLARLEAKVDLLLELVGRLNAMPKY